MKKNSIFMTAFLVVYVIGIQTISAQITITIPKLPKVKKPKIEQPKIEQPTATDDDQTDQSSQQDTNSSQADSSAKPEEMDAVLSFFLEEIEKTQQQVDEYTPEGKIYFVNSVGEEWLRRAVSPGERNEFYEKWKQSLTPSARSKFEVALKRLSDSAAKKLPLYKANPKAYNVRNPTEEKMMKGELENLANLKIHKIGLNQANWLISKNDYGLPISRYKNGMLWVRVSTDDHPYCKFYYVNIIQDYSGGGTYGASYAKFVGSELAGCPASQ